MMIKDSLFYKIEYDIAFKNHVNKNYICDLIDS